jgi:predicted nucleic acid-binding protein
VPADPTTQLRRLAVDAPPLTQAGPVKDTWIAACCLVHRLPLATFNTKDFADVAQHDGLELLDVS